MASVYLWMAWTRRLPSSWYGEVKWGDEQTLLISIYVSIWLWCISYASASDLYIGVVLSLVQQGGTDWTGLVWSGLVWSGLPEMEFDFFLSVIIILLWAFSKRDCCTGGQSREESLSVVRGVGFWEGISKCDWLMIEISGLESECVPWYLCATYSTTIQGWLESSEWMKRNFNTTIVVSVVPRTQTYHPRHTYHARIHSQRVEHWRCIETC